jgi:branched-chain amino acid transport system ATP-binding protein
MLKLEQIDTYYGVIRALKSLSLSVKEKAIITILGPNGAGKTTTVNSIMGVLKIKNGNIYFRDKRIDPLPTHQIARLGISLVSQERDIFHEMTVLENLEMGGYWHINKKEFKKNLARIYDYFPVLREKEKHDSWTLSGGEQQMLLIGRALIGNPQLLLLDEPSLGLAPLIVDLIFTIIQRINSEGITILVVEQNANMSLSIAHYGYVLEMGEIKIEGKAEDLITNEEVRKSYLGVK